jgi:hypothetical protein
LPLKAGELELCFYIYLIARKMLLKSNDTKVFYLTVCNPTRISVSMVFVLRKSA